jgi:hypothetical protein
MAYCIFLKSLRILEEFRKNPCVKIPPKSPCANFQSPGKFKNPIFILKRNFFQLLAQSAQPPHRPAWPFGPPGPPNFLLPPMQNRAGIIAAGLAPPPRAASASPAKEPLPRAPHYISRSFPLPPSSIHGVKHHLRESCFIPIHAGHSSTLITSRRPPPQPLYKGRAPSFSTAHLPALLLFSPPQVSPALSASSTISSPPSPRRLPVARTLVRPEMDSPSTPLPVAPPPAGHCAPKQLLG